MQLTITVKILFFGAAREVAGASEIELAVPAATTAQAAFEEVLTRFPAMREKFGKSLLFAVNQAYADPNQIVENADELAVFPPVSGG